MSVPQGNADIITPDAPASDTPIATNGGLEKNQSGELGVSVDGSTVTINGDGQLASSGYSAGPGISISSQNKISAKYDNFSIISNGGYLAVANPVPGSSSGDKDKVLTVDSSGWPTWVKPTKSIQVYGPRLETDKDGNVADVRIGGCGLELSPITSRSSADLKFKQLDSDGKVEYPWAYASANMAGTLGSDKYVVVKYSGVQNSSSTPFYRFIWSPDNTFAQGYVWTIDMIYAGTGKNAILPPPSIHPDFSTYDTSRWAKAGDWTGIADNITTWYLGIVYYQSRIISTVSCDPFQIACNTGIVPKLGNGLSFTQASATDNYAISVTVPVPAFDATTDEGKVLKIVNGAPAWVTP